MRGNPFLPFFVIAKEQSDCGNPFFPFEIIKYSCARAAHLTAVSPAGSVGASASQRCPPDTRTAMTGKRKLIRTPYVFAATKPLVILSAKRERIRNSL